MDRLIFLLTGPVQTHFKRKEARNLLGFHGLSIEEQLLNRARAKAASISVLDVQQKTETEFYVASQSTQGLKYLVNIEYGSCECPAFEKHAFCKHLIRCSNFHKEDIPLSSLEKSDFGEKLSVELQFKRIEKFISSARRKDLSSEQYEILEQVTALLSLLHTDESTGLPPNMNNSTITVHPFTKKKTRGRPKGSSGNNFE